MEVKEGSSSVSRIGDPLLRDGDREILGVAGSSKSIRLTDSSVDRCGLFTLEVLSWIS